MNGIANTRLIDKTEIDLTKGGLPNSLTTIKDNTYIANINDLTCVSASKIPTAGTAVSIPGSGVTRIISDKALNFTYNVVRTSLPSKFTVPEGAKVNVTVNTNGGSPWYFDKGGQVMCISSVTNDGNTYTFNYEAAGLSSANIEDYFTIAQSTYGFPLTAGVFKANNLGKNSSTATCTLTAKKAVTNLSLTYNLVSESNYDKLTITINGSNVVNAVSGTKTNIAYNYSGTIAVGQTVIFKYTKDSSSSASGEKAEISNLSGGGGTVNTADTTSLVTITSDKPITFTY